MGTRPGIHLVVTTERPRHGGTAHLVTRTLLDALRRRRVRRAALEVYVVSDAVMREVNRRTRGIDAPTTVLSFPTTVSAFPYPPAWGAPYLGEIYLAPHYIARRGEELSHYAVHALLHLLGYTHKRSRDTIEMEAEECRLLGAPKAVRHKQATNKRKTTNKQQTNNKR
ncbi:MAG: rRNA maturation RNase YbeY [bacterium]|nr:rRNA maturation RNase YbeY [bacterium]